ncbi:MAG: hypothetical protein I8H91_14190 [Burkholderiales bacterium]|nr:hypothetical protein [Burkholderiales bacterium]
MAAIRQWHPAGTTSYATRAKKNVEAVGRWEFTGGLASEKLRAKYLGKSVSHYFKRENTNPVFYVNAKTGT